MNNTQLKEALIKTEILLDQDDKEHEVAYVILKRAVMEMLGMSYTELNATVLEREALDEK